MTEAEQPLYSSYIVNCVFNAFSSCTAIMLNILTIHAMRKTLSLSKPLKTLLLSLAVSDLGVGFVVQPFNIATMIKQLQKNTVSPHVETAYYFITSVFAYTSFLGVVAISVDRLLAIHLHLRYQELVTQKRVVAVVVSIWVFSAFLSSTNVFILKGQISAVVVIAVVIGLCFICTAIIYCKIYITVRRHTNEINGLQVPQQEARNGELANAARQRKSAVGTFYIYLVFLVCCFPEYCRLLLDILLHDPNTISMRKFYYFSWTLLFLNSSLNPVVYCWKMRHIRRAIMDTMRNIFSKSQLNNTALNSDEGRSNNVQPRTVHSRRDTYC